MVKDVETLDPQFRSEPFRDLDVLGKDQVKIRKVRSIELVPADAAGSTEWRILKSSGIAKVHLVATVNGWIVVLARGKRVPHLIGP